MLKSPQSHLPHRSLQSLQTLLLGCALAALPLNALLAQSTQSAPKTGKAESPASAQPTTATATLPTGWWREASFYQVFVRSFADATQGPLANDGIGDLQGLTEKLDYLNDGKGGGLGVTALWLMPINPSPSYHGYDVTDYFQVNPQYGDLPTMKRFVAEAHRRGIRVIIDLVLNHASSQHPLFLRAKNNPGDTEARALFHFAPAPRELNGTWDQRVWHPSGREFYYGIFVADMPDWNVANPAVVAHHRRVADFWLKEVSVDGFRLDAVRYLYEREDELQDLDETKAWLRDFTQYCHSVKPGCFLVGECYADSRTIAGYAKQQAQDSLFEFGLSRAILESIRLEHPAVLKQTLAKLAKAYDGRQDWCSFITNHDQIRTLTQLDGKPELARLAAQLLFTLPGTPFMYYGEEIGMKGDKPDPDLRTPMQWTGKAPHAGFSAAAKQLWHPLNKDFKEVNVEAQDKVPGSMLTLYRHLVRLNATNPALRHGNELPVAASDDHVFASLRLNGDEWVLVLANLGAKPVKGLRLSAANSPLTAAKAGQLEEVLQGNGKGAPLPLAVSPKLGAQGAFEAWTPLAELAPHSVYVIRQAGAKTH